MCIRFPFVTKPSKSKEKNSTALRFSSLNSHSFGKLLKYGLALQSDDEKRDYIIFSDVGVLARFHVYANAIHFKLKILSRKVHIRCAHKINERTKEERERVMNALLFIQTMVMTTFANFTHNNNGWLILTKFTVI